MSSSHQGSAVRASRTDRPTTNAEMTSAKAILSTDVLDAGHHVVEPARTHRHPQVAVGDPLERLVHVVGQTLRRAHRPPEHLQQAARQTCGLDLVLDDAAHEWLHRLDEVEVGIDGASKRLQCRERGQQQGKLG